MLSLQNLWPLKKEKWLCFKSNIQGKTREVSFWAPCLLKAKLTHSEDGSAFSYGILRILHRLQQRCVALECVHKINLHYNL